MFLSVPPPPFHILRYSTPLKNDATCLHTVHVTPYRQYFSHTSNEKTKPKPLTQTLKCELICLLESNSRSFLEIGEAHTEVISTSMSIPADFILGTGHKKKMLNCDMCTISTIQLHDCSGSYVTRTRVLIVIQMSFNTLYNTRRNKNVCLYGKSQTFCLYKRRSSPSQKTPKSQEN